MHEVRIKLRGCAPVGVNLGALEVIIELGRHAARIHHNAIAEFLEPEEPRGAPRPDERLAMAWAQTSRALGADTKGLKAALVERLVGVQRAAAGGAPPAAPEASDATDAAPEAEGFDEAAATRQAKKMKVAELRAALEAAGADTKGLKAALVERLVGVEEEVIKEEVIKEEAPADRIFADFAGSQHNLKMLNRPCMRVQSSRRADGDKSAKGGEDDAAPALAAGPEPVLPAAPSSVDHKFCMECGASAADTGSAAGAAGGATLEHHATALRATARGHIGTYYKHLRDIVTHRDFAAVWSRATWHLGDALSRADTAHPVIVAFYCKSGKHRSVGLAWALTKILRERDWNVELRHTMREYWHIGSCRECAECARDTDEKLALLDDIRPQPGLLPDGP